MHVDDLIAEGARIHEATLAAFAMHKPKLLDDADVKWRSRIKARERGEQPPTDLRARAELIAYAKRVHADITSGRVLDDASTPTPEIVS